MLYNRKDIRKFIKLMIEGVSETKTIMHDGKPLLVVNDQTFFEGFLENLEQAQNSGATAFGQYYEDIISDTIGGLAPLNTGGANFPFADLIGGPGLNGSLSNTLFSVKMNRTFNPQKVGGGKINTNQIRQAIQRLQSVEPVTLGLIGGSLNIEIYPSLKNLGLPITISFIEPNSNSPEFIYVKGKSSKEDTIIVNKASQNYARNILGKGNGNPNYKNSTLTQLAADSFELNANDEIFESDSSHPLINNDALLAIYNSAKQKNPNNKIIAKQMDSNIKTRKNAIKKEIEKDYRNTSLIVSKVSFKSDIMDNKYEKTDSLSMLLTGGFPDINTIVKILKTKEGTHPVAISSLIARTEVVFGTAMDDLAKPKDKKEFPDQSKFRPMMLALKNIITNDKKMMELTTNNFFPDGIFIFNTGNKINIVSGSGYEKVLLQNGLKGLSAYEIKVGTLKGSQAAHLLIDVCKSKLLTGILEFNFPVSTTASSDDIARFKFRKTKVLPLANKVLPTSYKRYTREKLLHKLGLTENIAMIPTGQDNDYQFDQDYKDMEQEPEQIVAGGYSFGDVLDVMGNLASLVDEIIHVALVDISAGIEIVSDGFPSGDLFLESKIYRTVLKKLLECTQK